MTQQTQAPAKAVTKFDEATVEGVLSRIDQFKSSGELVLPPNYNAENAVRAAWLVLQDVTNRDGKPALEVCTKASIANAMLDMVLKGLSVVKKQGYFIVYGDKLQFDESYIGDIAIAKRDANVDEVNGCVIYEGDVFKYEIDLVNKGRKKVTLHEQDISNVKADKIIGAYAIVSYKDGTSLHEIMTMPQIKLAWQQGAAKGNSPAHRNFPDQMAIKTVINRALKIVTGTTDDSLVMQDAVVEAVRTDIRDNANKTPISIDRKPEPVRLKQADPIPVSESSNTEDASAELNGQTKLGPDF